MNVSVFICCEPTCLSPAGPDAGLGLSWGWGPGWRCSVDPVLGTASPCLCSWASPARRWLPSCSPLLLPFADTEMRQNKWENYPQLPLGWTQNACAHLFEVSYPVVECLSKCVHVSLSLLSHTLGFSGFTTSQTLQRFPEKHLQERLGKHTFTFFATDIFLPTKILSDFLKWHQTSVKWDHTGSDTHDAETSSSCFSARSLFIDSNSTFSSMFYKQTTFSPL